MVRRQQIEIARASVVPVVGDAAVMGRDVAEGRLLPVLILDTGEHPRVAELIRLHRHLPDGDVYSQWGGRVNGDPDSVVLLLHFLQPMDLTVYLVFSIERQAMLIDLMVSGGGVYLQAGSPGDRLIKNLDADRLRVELVEGGFRRIWDELLMTQMTAVMAKRLGVRGRKARPAAQRMVSEIKKFTAQRMR
jgi:hypothetical protein